VLPGQAARASRALAPIRKPAYAKAAFKNIAANNPGLIAEVERSGLGDSPALIKFLSRHGRLDANFAGDFTISRTLRIYALRSDHPIATVLDPGYFDDLADVGLRKHDEIRLVANYNGVGEHALLVVDHVRQGKATVSLLHRYERQQ
jgi:hypothetical protein